MSLEVRVVPDGATRRVELLLEGKAVSRLWIHDLTWRVGSAHVRMGGIGGVGTDSTHRNKGYSRRCLDRACGYMREEGYEMSALFGISAFYHKWGFASVMPEPRLTISTRAAEESVRPAGVRVRIFHPKRHAREILEIYELNNRVRSGSLVRPTAAKWQPFRMGSGFFTRAESFVVTGARGRVLGYASHDVSKTEVIVAEAGCREPEGYAAVTAELARRAVVRRTGEIVFLLPVDHPFAAYLQRWDVTHRLAFAKWGAGMARIMNVAPALEKCSREFERRIAGSGLRGGSFSLCFVTDIGAATILARKGRVRIRAGAGAGSRVEVPQSVLTQWLLGYRGPGEGAAGVAVPAEAAGPIEALFPKGFPYMFPADRF